MATNKFAKAVIEVETRPFEVTFVLTHNFSLMAFASAIEPLRAANRLAGKDLYSWQLIGPTAPAVYASNGMAAGIDFTSSEAGNAKFVVVCGGPDEYNFNDPKTFAWLRRIAVNGATIGAISTGSFILADAGLLDGYQCTIHWESIAAFRETYSSLNVVDDLFVIDRDRFTCSGGTASMDLMLQLITEQHGKELATSIAAQFIHERVRHEDDKQVMDPRHRLGVVHPRLRETVLRMEQNIETPISCTELARHAGLSARQLERLFRKYFDTPPARFYLNLRLEQARNLLRQTAMPILDVAIACGFESASHFSKCYKERYETPPSMDR